MAVARTGRCCKSLDIGRINTGSGSRRRRRRRLPAVVVHVLIIAAAVIVAAASIVLQSRLLLDSPRTANVMIPVTFTNSS